MKSPAALRSLIALAVLTAPAVAAQPAVYTAVLSADLDSLELELCFGDRPATVLQGHDGAGRFVSGIRATGGADARLGSDDRINVRGARAGDCVGWNVAIAAAAREQTARFGLTREEPVLPAGTWLWRSPEEPEPPLLRLELPDGLAASVPWPPLADGRAGQDYRLDPSPAGWPNLTAFGRFTERHLDIGGGRLRVAVLAGTPAADEDSVLRWLTANAEAVAGIYGRFPVPRAQLLVVPIGRSGEPVPWAQVNRGGGSGVHFFIDQTRAADAFLADWTAAHELSHLLLPFVERSHAWLSEGVASYYQNLSRPRVGLLDAETAWTKLHAGFRRGEAQSGDLSLREVSRRMHRDRAYMRVYWSGAAIALIADTRLRVASGNRESLATVLERLSGCCLPSSRPWSATELLRRLDELGGDGVFMALYDRWIDSSEFPDYRAAYARLGIEAHGGQLRFSPEPAARRLRDAMMGIAVGSDPAPEE